LNTTLRISELLSAIDLELFLTQNKHLTAEKFILGSKDNTKELNSLLAQQLVIYPKAYNKVPTFTRMHCWFTNKSYEQASSETSALFKSTLFSGEKILDLSGGLGVDDWAFSQSFKEVISLDPDIFLNTLVRENFKKLGISNIQRLDKTAEDYLIQTEEKFDLIFLDADRRNEKGKVFFLEQSQPNYLELEPICKKIAPQVLLKLSPMVDLVYLKNSLSDCAKIWILGDKTEVKEILVWIDFTKKKPIETEVVILQDNGNLLSYTGKNEPLTNQFKEGNYDYFFEPHACIIKSNLYAEYAYSYELKLLATQSMYFLGNKVPEMFIGRSFQLVQQMPYSKTTFKKYLQEEGIEKANISKRNFPLEVSEIRKTFKIAEGGEIYLFFSSNEKGEKYVFHCKKID